MYTTIKLYGLLNHKLDSNVSPSHCDGEYKQFLMFLIGHYKLKQHFFHSNLYELNI